jgi:hypothetical protein
MTSRNAVLSFCVLCRNNGVLKPITENTSPESGGLHLSTATVSHLPTNEYQQAKRGEKLAISRTRRSLLLWSIQCSIET